MLHTADGHSSRLLMSYSCKCLSHAACTTLTVIYTEVKRQLKQDQSSVRVLHGKCYTCSRVHLLLKQHTWVQGQQQQFSVLRRRFDDVQPTLLLFLQRLQCIIINDAVNEDTSIMVRSVNASLSATACVYSITPFLVSGNISCQTDTASSCTYTLISREQQQEHVLNNLHQQTAGQLLAEPTLKLRRAPHIPSFHWH